MALKHAKKDMLFSHAYNYVYIHEVDRLIKLL